MKKILFILFALFIGSFNSLNAKEFSRTAIHPNAETLAELLLSDENMEFTSHTAGIGNREYEITSPLKIWSDNGVFKISGQHVNTRAWNPEKFDFYTDYLSLEGTITDIKEKELTANLVIHKYHQYIVDGSFRVPPCRIEGTFVFDRSLRTFGIDHNRYPEILCPSNVSDNGKQVFENIVFYLSKDVFKKNREYLFPDAHDIVERKRVEAFREKDNYWQKLQQAWSERAFPNETKVFNEEEAELLLGKHFASTYRITKVMCSDYIDAEEYKRGNNFSDVSELGEVEITKIGNLYKLIGGYERYYDTERPYDPTEKDGGHIKMDGVITEIHDGYFLFEGEIEALILERISDIDREENNYEPCRYPPRIYKFSRMIERQPECSGTRYWSLDTTSLPEHCFDYMGDSFVHIDILLDDKVNP